MIDPKTVTAIVPHFGATDDQEYAFNQFYASFYETKPEGLELFIAKNGSIGCTHPRNLRVLSQGQCKAVNAAVACTNTEWILVTNDDMVYPPGWFETLTSDIYGQPLVCPKLIEPRPGAPTFEVYFCGGAGGDFDRTKWLEFAKNYHGTGFRHGFNLPFLMKRDLWDMVGGYDINYDPWGSNSDSDLEYKIKIAGVQPFQQTNCIVYHFSQTSGTFEPKHQDAWQVNWAYFRLKWGFYRTDDHIWEAEMIIPSLPEGRTFQPEWEGKYGS
jgi:GT2 family glycosyltransferase